MTPRERVIDLIESKGFDEITLEERKEMLIKALDKAIPISNNKIIIYSEKVKKKCFHYTQMEYRKQMKKELKNL